ncbi:tetratricopeptide repeat protein [Methylobacterium frigidaeris]|nr:tetratricopeptide repeat protein [Methylobacterium frigidaeris]
MRAVEIDGEIPALDISIYLRNEGRHREALTILERVRAKNPLNDIAYYQAALNSAMMGNLTSAVQFGRRALQIQPSNVEYRSLLARALSIAGQTDAARRLMLTSHETNPDHRNLFERIGQFIDYCEAHPLQGARDTLDRFIEDGLYLEADAVRRHVLEAVAQGRPFSFARLGDGEGAWLSFNDYDEGRYAALYRGHRIEFLRDWFGTDRLIHAEDFFRFSIDLQTGFAGHDLIGIPPKARLDQEQGFLSTRGITSSVNVFRFLEKMSGPASTRFTSNSMNLTLNDTPFYRDLISAGRPFGIITSQSGLADLLRGRGVTVDHAYVVPGDSRNFSRGEGSNEPVCQYPHFLEQVDAHLGAESQAGRIWLVAAGYVGKRYIQTVRNRGGVAIDLGSLADHWARNGLP